SGLPRDPEAVTVPYLARDMVEVFDRCDITDAVCIGHSMGVQVAIEMAFRSPHRVRGLVLICGAPGRALDTFQNTDTGKRMLPHIKVMMDNHRDTVAKALRLVMPTDLAYFVAQNTELNKELVRKEDFMPYLEHFASMPPKLFIRMLEDASERRSAAYLGRLGGPTLVIAGERDGFTPARVSRAMAEALPQASYELLPEGSHTAPIELPKPIEALIQRFFDDHGFWEEAPDPPTTATLADRFRARAAKGESSGLDA
ncbi:MAG: alpha/beta hydrolase, partial [Myxococcota bacterium]|nr:alpha/beta hydrolase [Myxococcota bacterium]